MTSLDSAQDPLDRGDREALEGRDGEVAVEVVAVSRVDAGAKPRARIGELDRRSPHSRDQLGQRPRLHGDPLLQPERLRSLEAAALEPVVEQVVVVVSRHHHDPSAADRGPELVEERSRQLERLRQRAVAQLDRVAQQHDLVGALDLGPQGLAELWAAEQVDVAARAEVEVGEDQRAHDHMVAPGGAVRAAGRCVD